MFIGQPVRRRHWLSTEIGHLHSSQARHRYIEYDEY